MTRKPTIEVTGLNFKDFIQSNKVCILKAQVGAFAFGDLSKLQFEKDYRDEVNFGVINIRRAGYRSRAIQDFIKVDMPKIGLHVNSILPGYFLFKNGILKAYHPGTLDLENTDPNELGFGAIIGAAAGLIVGIATKSTARGFGIFFETMEMFAAKKVSEFFKEMAGAYSSSYSQQRQQFVYNEEVSKAYQLLDVTPNATDAEVKKAWKKLMSENHPDKHPNDIDVKTKYCVELNNAYDLIRKHRAANN